MYYHISRKDREPYNYSGIPEIDSQLRRFDADYEKLLDREAYHGNRWDPNWIDMRFGVDPIAALHRTWEREVLYGYAHAAIDNLSSGDRAIFELYLRVRDYYVMAALLQDSHLRVWRKVKRIREKLVKEINWMIDAEV